MNNRYLNSNLMLKRALNVIPLGSQTFSKSICSYPRGVSPLFIDKAKGAKVWDIDGNEYIDFVNGLAAVTLGYSIEEINEAVKAQMDDGVVFSLPHKLEAEIAEMLVDIIPCAEKVRFAKNGTDATSAAVRVSRAFTKREHIAVCGYHGWQDWYIGSTTRDEGIPGAVKSLTHKFQYNNIESLKAILKKFQLACVIIEPMNIEYPKNNFLNEVRELCSKNKILLVFDETVTGFRYSLGGAQEFFGVTPDLSTFGKGMANGFPLSAIVGKEKYMKKVEDIFFSGTFGGETMSLAGAKAVINFYKENNVIGYIKDIGTYLIDKFNNLIAKEKLEDLIVISGHPSWSFIQFKQQKKFTSMELKTFFLQEVFRRGFIVLSSHNISYSHNKRNIDDLIECYSEVFCLMKKKIKSNSLTKAIECSILEPIFKIR